MTADALRPAEAESDATEPIMRAEGIEAVQRLREAREGIAEPPELGHSAPTAPACPLVGNGTTCTIRAVSPVTSGRSCLQRKAQRHPDRATNPRMGHGEARGCRGCLTGTAP